jgi:hypothetical protein
LKLSLPPHNIYRFKVKAAYDGPAFDAVFTGYSCHSPKIVCY